MAVAVKAPGTQLFAPQARLVDADSDQIIGATIDKQGAPNPANVDLVSASVSLSLNNVCTLQVVLNNQRDRGGLPVFPPWKYNSLAQIKFGQRLRLDIRYGADPWHKMILSRVTDLQFGFPSSGPAQLTIQGEDLLSLLKTTGDAEKRYDNHTEEFAVRDVLVRSKAKDLHLDFTGATPVPSAEQPDPLKGPLMAWPEVLQQPLRSLSHSKDTTYLQFLQNLAERLDFELFVDFTERLVLDSQASSKATAQANNRVKLHFEPARSLFTPRRALDLIWGTNLVEFTPRFKVWELATSVKVGGTSHGRRARHGRTVEGKAGPDDHNPVRADLKEDPHYKATGISGKVDLLDAGQVRSQFFTAEGTPAPNPKTIDTTNLDEGRTVLKAIATLRKSLRELLTADGSTIGVPELRPGVYVRIDGLYPPFDGLYYVTKTDHTFGSDGYRTKFSVRRPGMLDPSKYPAIEGTP
jgi:hypothetical protein